MGLSTGRGICDAKIVERDDVNDVITIGFVEETGTERGEVVGKVIV